jgi:hypothetical protein
MRMSSEDRGDLEPPDTAQASKPKRLAMFSNNFVFLGALGVLILFTKGDATST